MATRANFNLNGYEIHQSTPYLQSWNLTVERQFGSSAVEVGILRLQGHAPEPVQQHQSGTEHAGLSHIRDLGAINYYFFESNSSYNAASITLRRRFVRGFFYSANYVYSKTIDEASQSAGISNGGSNGLQNVNCLRCDRGRADWDIPHAFTMNFSWTAPFHNRLIHGWQLAGSGRVYSGFGFTPVSKAPAGTVRPDRIAKGTLPDPSVDRWFDITAFPATRGPFRQRPGATSWMPREGQRQPESVEELQNLGTDNLQFRWEASTSSTARISGCRCVTWMSRTPPRSRQRMPAVPFNSACAIRFDIAWNVFISHGSLGRTRGDCIAVTSVGSRIGRSYRAPRCHPDSSSVHGLSSPRTPSLIRC